MKFVPLDGAESEEAIPLKGVPTVKQSFVVIN
jgi:hypothetical protein